MDGAPACDDSFVGEQRSAPPNTSASDRERERERTTLNAALQKKPHGPYSNSTHLKEFPSCLDRFISMGAAKPGFPALRQASDNSCSDWQCSSLPSPNLSSTILRLAVRSKISKNMQKQAETEQHWSRIMPIAGHYLETKWTYWMHGKIVLESSKINW